MIANPRLVRSPGAILAAGAVVLALSMGIRHTFGMFLTPMSQDNGWTREVFAFAIALQNLVWGLAQPFAGRLADRNGAGWTILGGSLLYALGLLLMALSSSVPALLLSGGVMVGLALSGTGFPVVFGALARAMPAQKRSAALGMAMSVASLGQFAMLPGSLTLIDGLGWGMALVVLAILAAGMVPLARMLDEPGTTLASAAPPMALRAILCEALWHRGFWLLSFGFFVCGFHVVFIATHLPTYLVDKGLSVKTGAIVLALIGLFNVAGAYCAGLWGGRVSKPWLLSGIYFARALVIAAFVWLPVSEGTAYAFGAAMGLLWLSTAPLTNGTVATVFGVQNLSMLGGIVFLFHQVGGFLGGWLGGRLFVVTGGYEPVWWAAIALALVAAALNAPIREQPLARLRAQAA